MNIVKDIQIRQIPRLHAEHFDVLIVGAGISGIDRAIGSAFDIDVRTVMPTDIAECPEAIRPPCRSPALITAIGLAQYGD